jgi:low affinity Fe/Cu permease
MTQFASHESAPSGGDLQSDSVAAERTPHSFSSRLAFVSAGWAGSGALAAATLAFCLIWLLVGAAADFPRWWELAITVGVPLVSLQMLIVVQHTASHANQATQLKLDELIRASEGATNHLMTVEDSSRSDLQRIHAEFSDQRLGEALSDQSG